MTDVASGRIICIFGDNARGTFSVSVRKVLSYCAYIVYFYLCKVFFYDAVLSMVPHTRLYF